MEFTEAHIAQANKPVSESDTEMSRALTGSRNRSTTCLYHCGQNQQTCLKCLILLVVCNFSPSDSNGQTGIKFAGKVYCIVLHLGEGPGADCALCSGRQWSLNGA